MGVLVQRRRGNAAIVTASSLRRGLFTNARGQRDVRFILAQALLWLLCLINVLGIKVSARIQISVLFLNIVPLLLFSIIALFYFDAANLTPFAPKGWGSLVTGVALIVWAYSGIESATVPAEEVRGTSHTIGRATLIGYAVGTAAFLFAAVAVAGVVPNAELATPRAPSPGGGAHHWPWRGRSCIRGDHRRLGTLKGGYSWPAASGLRRTRRYFFRRWRVYTRATERHM